ncbi:hypothetical protein EJ04DRAFT_581944 [Polyplosphaeria fusca]|uniref:Mitochondrial import inner membrane translocase subunit TIM54 n=1 Tax=Polyplosphaeria fusca TaxID=682080 RepID=A0A9P4QMF5_9PLEO|nr:hypothetical protein EJ04DRAFT_581944 [Polyplosphaeria fusca]
MADQDAKGPAKPQKPPNPVWRMMGLPNFRLKLPSRNWMIFLTLTASWTAAVTYDRREKRRVQRKWARLVEHIAKEPLYEHQMPRKLTVYLEAPPADGLVPARDHFHEHVKPILVAAALDWDAIEGRREGDVRAGLAEKIRRIRKKTGEASQEPVEADVEEIVDESRTRAGIPDWDGTRGDIVIGRHTWKEYVRGLHEGWLGPLDPPAQPQEASDSISPLPIAPDDASPTLAPDAPPPQEGEKAKEEDKDKAKKKKTQPAPFNTTVEYSDALGSPHLPQELGPTAIIPLPHLLGFLNFPIRIYRFLNKRQVADEVGRQTAAAVLASYRPFEGPGESHTLGADDGDEATKWEQQRILEHEEPEWHKSARERKDDDERERVWLDDMVIDARIGERMRRFMLTGEEERRANQLANVASEKDEPWWKSIWPQSEKKKGAWEELE